MSRVMKAIIAAMAAGLAAPAAAQPAAKKEFKADKIKLVEVRTESGPIRIAGASTWVVRAQPTGNQDPSKCVIVMVVQGSTLLLEARAAVERKKKAAVCPAGFLVEVPLDLPVSASSGSGEVRVGPRESETRLSAGSGPLVLEGPEGRLIARAGSGEVRGTVGSEDLDVMTGSGKVLLEWSVPLFKGQAVVRSGSGDVTLAFPSETSLRDEVWTGAGRYVNEFGAAGASSFRVRVESGAGDVTIRRTN